jgi:hypothetical protein
MPKPLDVATLTTELGAEGFWNKYGDRYMKEVHASIKSREGWAGIVLGDGRALMKYQVELAQSKIIPGEIRLHACEDPECPHCGGKMHRSTEEDA